MSQRRTRLSDDRYVSQRRGGFPWLRFLPDVEREYRESFIGLNGPRIRIAHVVGILAVLGFIVMDQYFGANLQAAHVDLTLIMVTVPALMIPIIATFFPRAGPQLPRVIFIASTVMGLSIIWVIWAGRSGNPWFPYESLHLVTIYIYFVSGLLFYEAMVCGLLIWVGFLATNWNIQPHALLVYEGYYLFLANLIGALGLYFYEGRDRYDFLLENELRQQAGRDGLTGLSNRRAFHAHFEKLWWQARREKLTVGVMLSDIDGFKRINDSYGHLFGDQVLSRVAESLSNVAQRPLDMVCRYGGDEFIVAWFAVDRETLDRVARSVPKSLSVMYTGSERRQVSVQISGGAVLAFPDTGIEPHDAISSADQLLYEAKRQARGTIKTAVLSGPGDRAQSADAGNSAA